MNADDVLNAPAPPVEIHVGLSFVHVPGVAVEPCECKRTYETTDPNALAAARRGEELRLRCGCGRVLVAQKRHILKPSLVAQ